MLTLLIYLLVLCLILGLILYVFQTVPILAPFAWVAKLLCVVVIVLFLIEILLGIPHGGFSTHPLLW